MRSAVTSTVEAAAAAIAICRASEGIRIAGSGREGQLAEAGAGDPRARQPIWVSDGNMDHQGETSSAATFVAFIHPADGTVLPMKSTSSPAIHRV
jgi:hypothetical protein